MYGPLLLNFCPDYHRFVRAQTIGVLTHVSSAAISFSINA